MKRKVEAGKRGGMHVFDPRQKTGDFLKKKAQVTVCQSVGAHFRLRLINPALITLVTQSP